MLRYYYRFLKVYFEILGILGNLVYFSVFQGILGNFRECQCNTRVFKVFLGDCEVFYGIQGNFIVFNGILWYFRVLQGILGNVKIFQGFQCILWYFRLF